MRVYDTMYKLPLRRFCILCYALYMDVFQATILGAVQGITEFLPVSSSGHLVLWPWIFGWEYQGTSFDAAVHVGTLLGVVGYFWREWKGMIGSLKRGYKKDHFEQKLLFFILLATVPGAVAGYLFKDFIEGVLRAPEIVAAALILFSFVILAGEKFGKKIHGLATLNWQKALLVGLFQALAIIPGISRSGATISAGLLLGLSRKDAAKFSFLIAAPIIFGAGLFKFPDILEEGINLIFLAGIISSAVSGYFAIKFLFKYLERASYMAFVWYRIVFGLVIFGLIWFT